jgi:NADH-quinone oxidoreductase subunit L
MFHFFTHAFFKALLFLAAGAIIHAVHNEQDMFKMGGLRKKLPGVFWTFVIGCASLAALPLVTSGFYSKDYILVKTLTSEAGSVWFAAAGILGAAITAFYTARMVGLTFFGEAKTEVGHRPGAAMMLPLVILAVGSTFGGFLETPQTLGHITFFQDVLKGALSDIKAPYLSIGAEAGLQAGVTGLVVAAIAVAWKRYGRGPEGVPAPDSSGFFARGWGFDDAYDALILKPYTQVCQWLRSDVIDALGNLVAGFVQFFHHVLSLTQSGLLRKYAFGLAGGGLVVLFLVLYL